MIGFIVTYRAPTGCGNQSFTSERFAREFIAENKAYWISWTLYTFKEEAANNGVHPMREMDCGRCD